MTKNKSTNRKPTKANPGSGPRLRTETGTGKFRRSFTLDADLMQKLEADAYANRLKVASMLNTILAKHYAPPATAATPPATAATPPAGGTIAKKAERA